MSILDFKELEITKIENISNTTNLNMIKIECLNNIAVCSYVKKDYQNVLEKTNEVKIQLNKIKKLNKVKKLNKSRSLK